MRRPPAFTLVELLAVIAIIGLLCAISLPALGRSLRQAKRIQCVNNLRQIGLAFQQFADDHHSRYPMQIGHDEGGAREATEGSTNRIEFLVLSAENFTAVERELTTPKLLVCKTDSLLPAATFEQVGQTGTSYRVSAMATPGGEVDVLAADRNLAVSPKWAPRPDRRVSLGFDTSMHDRRGNLLMTDGRVEWVYGIVCSPWSGRGDGELQPIAPGLLPPGQTGDGRAPQVPGTPNATWPSSPPVATALPSRELNSTNREGLVLEASTDEIQHQPVASLIPLPPGFESAPRRGSRWPLWLLLALAIWVLLRKRHRSSSEPGTEEGPAGLSRQNAVAESGTLAITTAMKQFFTGAAINADLLVTMLEKHGIKAQQEFAHASPRDDEDEYSRETVVYVPEESYERAHQLFYAERQDEL